MAGVESFVLENVSERPDLPFIIGVAGKTGIVGAQLELMGSEGLVGITDETARLIAVEKLGALPTDNVVIWARPSVIPRTPERDKEEIFEFFNGRVQIFTGQRLVCVDGGFKYASRIRFNILELLARHVGQEITFDVLDRVIWNGRGVSKSNIRTHIGKIRYEILGPNLAYAVERTEGFKGYRLNPKFVPKPD